MRHFRLEIWANRCAVCGLEFESLHLRGDYEPIVYTGGDGEQRFLDPAADLIWGEAKTLIKSAARASDVQLTAMAEAQLFHKLLAETVDLSSHGEAFVSPWEIVPCASCGSRQRAESGPKDNPPTFRDVSLAPVTHDRWHAMSNEQKTATALRVIADAKANDAAGPRS